MRSHPYTPPPPLPPILDELATLLPNQTFQTARRHGNDRDDDGYSDSASGSHIPFRGLDPETSQLLPVAARPTKRVHVRVQGRLALVQSVSAVDLRQTTRRDGRSVDPGVGSLVVPSPRHHHGRDLRDLRDRSDRHSTYSAGESRRSGLGSEGVSEGVSEGFSSTNRNSPSPRSFVHSLAETESDTEEEERETVLRDRQLRGYGIGGAGNIRRPTEVAQFPSRRISSMTLFSSVSSSGATSPIGRGPDGRRWNLRDIFGGRRSERKGKGRATDLTVAVTP